MLGFIARRLVSSVAVLFLASIVVFLVVTSMGDPMGDLKTRNPRPPQSVFDAKRRELNLDKPLPVRYGIWLGKFVQGDMGEDVNGRDVQTRLTRGFFVTLRMSLVSAFLAVILAVAVGVYSAVRQYSVSDYVFTFFGFLFLSMPVFWLAGLLKEFGAIELNDAAGRRLVYTVGDQSPNLEGSFGERLGDYAGHMALPTLALMLVTYAAWSRYQRATMLDVLNSDYVRLARAKGLSNRRVLVKHALRNALIPLTTVVAVDVGGVFAGAVITERVFAWRGMGSILIESFEPGSYDVNTLLAWVMLTGIFVVLFNLIADILYGVLDPRIRVA
jgi:peptide/nickel transport system permease protein